MSLALASALHLSGHVSGHGAPFDALHAGIGEAIIGGLLLIGALIMIKLNRRARAAGLVTNTLAILGFLNGASMTTRGGHWPDIAYHLVVLPLLIGSAVALILAGRRSRHLP